MSSSKLIKSTNQFPVVGIGASAGGLDAFKKLLSAIPEDSGICYVLVQHLDPTHESQLPEILQKFTKLPILSISDDIEVLPNHIYILPSNKMLVANDGVLHLSPRNTQKNERNLPIDLFFKSLAEVHESYAIGIILSGTGTDGTIGLKAIKDHGGITISQDQASAAFDGMPSNAIQAGVVDFILPPGQMPAKLLEILSVTKVTNNEDDGSSQQNDVVFKQILSVLRIRKGTDFTYYKQTTIHRRILRRMALNKNEDPEKYLAFLRENKAEQLALYQDLLIPVTSFFRDTHVFENLFESIFPGIVAKANGEPIRVWIAGCSTGEEAYSIAICLKEFLDNRSEKVQIFASDLSEPAIAKARIGIYSKSEVAGVSPERLKVFFAKVDGSYQINKQVRDMCVFATHNFLKDPPFGKMDLITCRNVLIYMEPYLQKKALTTFHYSLKPNGFLLLGKSETISSVPDLFSLSNKSDKVFSRKDVAGRFTQVASQRNEYNSGRSNDTQPKYETVRTDFQKTADDIMLSKYTPAGVVVNEAMDIVHFRGSTSNYLEQSPGKPSHNLLKMAREGLAFELRNILHKAKKDKVPIIKENIPLQVNGIQRSIAIEAMLLPNTIEPHYLILFHDQGAIFYKQPTVQSKKTKADNGDIRIEQLEGELAQTREDMRSITEDQEAINEELQSANEELLSSSEELQSLNEELETSKEELQSTNEELIIVNQEMVALNEQVTRARDHAEAIIATMIEPMLVLDKSLYVKKANPAFYRAFKVTENNTEGKLVYNIGNNQWDIPALRVLLEKILPDKSTFSEFEMSHDFLTIGQRTMLLNAREIKNEPDGYSMILLAINDITDRKLVEDALERSEAKFKHLADFMPQKIWTTDTEGNFNYFNENWHTYTGF